MLRGLSTMQNMQPLPAPPPLPTCYTGMPVPIHANHAHFGMHKGTQGTGSKQMREGDRWEKKIPTPRPLTTPVQSITVGWTQ